MYIKLMTKQKPQQKVQIKAKLLVIKKPDEELHRAAALC